MTQKASEFRICRYCRYWKLICRGCKSYNATIKVGVKIGASLITKSFFLFGCLTLNNIWGHESCSVVIALELTSCQVPLDLEREQVPGVLLLQLTGVRDVELHHKPQQWLMSSQANLVIHRLVPVQPILNISMLI